MEKKKPVRGSEPEEAYEGDLEDALMLDEPGTIVEPDVRKALLKYFKDMKMLEGAGEMGVRRWQELAGLLND
jgi:hypothetical protein